MTPSEMILMFRQKCIKFYKQYEKMLFPIIKFMITFSLILMINDKIGYMGALNKAGISIGIALISAMLPIRYINIILMIVISIHMSILNIWLGIGVIIFFVSLYCMYIRLYPEESLLIIITMLAMNFKIGYAVPLIAGLFGGLACLLPIAMGVLFSYMCQEMGLIMETITRGISENTIELCISIINKNLISNISMLATICVFSVVFLVVYIIRKLAIDYAPYIAIVLGGVMNLLGFGFAILFFSIEINVFLLVGMTILSIMLATICQFTAKVLDYSRAEVVQFEDEDNYYYVRVVPKVSMNVNKKKVEQVYTTTTKENSLDL